MHPKSAKALVSRSYLREELLQGNAERINEFRQARRPHSLLASLDASVATAAKSHSMCHLFLRKPGLFPQGAHALPESRLKIVRFLHLIRVTAPGEEHQS